MWRHIIKTGAWVGLAAGAIAGCSWPQWTTKSNTSSPLAERSSKMPVAPRTSAVVTNTSGPAMGVAATTAAARARAGMTAANESRHSGSSSTGGFQIDSGTPATADEARQGVMSDQMAASLLETATVLELRGNLEAAKQQYERAISVAPHDLKLLVSYARFADRHGQGSVAADLYQRVLDSDGANPLLWSEAGLSLARNGRGDVGLAACRKALNSAPDNGRFRTNLAEAENAARHFQEGTTTNSELLVSSRAPREETRTAALPVSVPTEEAVPVEPTQERTLPFSPGSTARQFERALPPVKSNRRATSSSD